MLCASSGLVELVFISFLNLESLDLLRRSHGKRLLCDNDLGYLLIALKLLRASAEG